MGKRVLLWIVLVLLFTLLIAANGSVLHEAMFYDKLEGDAVQCRLCPLNCTIKKSQTGVCGVRENIGGKLFSKVYGKPVAIHIDPIEKKPLYHFLPGTKILSLATAGCNLRCNFCQNWEISQSKPDELRAYSTTPEDVVKMAIENGCKSIAFTYTEPTIFYEYMLDIAKLAHETGIFTVWVTCGYINEEPLKTLLPWIDAANIDLKGFSEDFYNTYTTGDLAPVLRSIELSHEASIELEITNLIIPGANDDPEIIRRMCGWLKDTVGVDTPLHFSRFFPNFRLTNRPATPEKTLDMAWNIAQEAGLRYVYLGNIRTDKEDTYCPNCGKKLIDRTGYRINFNDVVDGKCKHCGFDIYGTFEKP